MGIPTGPVDRSQGDVHALGNPHYMMDPVNAGIVARNIAAAMKRLQAGDADLFDRNLKAFLARLEEKEKEWKGRLAPFKGTKVVTYHQNFDYFAARFGLVIVDNIEPKPGIDPSPTDVQQLMVTMKEQGVKLVIIEPIRSRRTPEKLARSSGADVVVLPFMADADRKTSTYVDWIDHCISLLENSLKQ